MSDDTVRAGLSPNRKHVICGACRRSLCRRDRRERGGHVEHLLAWEDGWHVAVDHVEMMAGARERLLDGNRPIRRDWANEERIRLTRALLDYSPAVCPWCGTMNVIDATRLDVNGIAPH